MSYRRFVVDISQHVVSTLKDDVTRYELRVTSYKKKKPFYLRPGTPNSLFSNFVLHDAQILKAIYLIETGIPATIHITLSAHSATFWLTNPA